MIRTKLPQQKYLKECLRYESKTGKLFWKKRPLRHFVSRRWANTWNTRWAGREALNYSEPDSYGYGSLDGVPLAAHRVVWKMVSGQEPPALIDHKDRNKKNNKFKNLRAANSSQNGLNRNLSKANKSGRTGVSYNARDRKWLAQLSFNGQVLFGGLFKNKRDAIQARAAIESMVCGEFAQ